MCTQRVFKAADYYWDILRKHLYSRVVVRLRPAKGSSQTGHEMLYCASS